MKNVNKILAKRTPMRGFIDSLLVLSATKLGKLVIENILEKSPISNKEEISATMESEGYAKVISAPKYGEILGIHLIGPRAADLIPQEVIRMAYEVTDEDMFRIFYANPTYSEALKEAYFIPSCQGALNIYNNKIQ